MALYGVLLIVSVVGSSRESLSEQYREAHIKLRAAIEAFEKIDFNARDYYPISDEAFTKARKERDDIMVKLSEADKYLLQHRQSLKK